MSRHTNAAQQALPNDPNGDHNNTQYLPSTVGPQATPTSLYWQLSNGGLATLDSYADDVQSHDPSQSYLDPTAQGASQVNEYAYIQPDSLYAGHAYQHYEQPKGQSSDVALSDNNSSDAVPPSTTTSVAPICRSIAPAPTSSATAHCVKCEDSLPGACELHGQALSSSPPLGSQFSQQHTPLQDIRVKLSAAALKTIVQLLQKEAWFTAAQVEPAVTEESPFVEKGLIKLTDASRFDSLIYQNPNGNFQCRIVHKVKARGGTQLCRLVTKKPKDVAAHVRSYLNYRPYKCDTAHGECQKTFTTAARRNDHHSKVKKGKAPLVQCGACEVEPMDPRNLRRHFVKAHPGVGEYTRDP